MPMFVLTRKDLSPEGQSDLHLHAESLLHKQQPWQELMVKQLRRIVPSVTREAMKHRILVVEDNPLNRELLCDWLEAEGHEVVSVEDLGGAFRALGDERPDAVLLDVQLGDEDGLSLATWMRQQPKLCRVPVIAVTAHAMVTEPQRFLEAGCTACVSKPVNFKLLGEQLERWLQPRSEQPSAS